MTEKAVLIEKSFADAIAMIAAAEELPEELKRHWSTSLRQFAKATDRPLEVIPARYSAVRNELAKWHHAPSGLTPKTVMNHRSNKTGAALSVARKGNSRTRGAPDGRLGKAPGARQRQPDPVPTFIPHPILLCQQHPARGGR